nr:phage-related minor tail protein [uncultured Mediterranean phage uvMED]BAR23557.1 phage-related minor tail protein [uncultured Mediterranean phage uvMED]
MAENPTVLKIRAEVENLQGLNRLKTAVRRVSQEVKASNVDFKKQIANIKELQVNTKNSVNNLRAQKDAFMALRDSVDLTSKEFKQATAEVAKLDAALAKAEGRKAQRGGRLAGIAKGVGAIAAGGVFGGPEGAIGGAIGLGLGGPAGAAVGAAIGAQLGMVRQAAGAVGETVATFNKYQIALAGVSKDQEDFNVSLDAARGFSEQFVVPLDQTIEQYTKLKASVVGAGLGTEETNKAFEALSASVIATGGSSEDLNAALRAASQVFSKGKVSAEELRQQIGERLPGAFTIFADSMGITTKQLDKLLEDGKVTLADFVGFTEELTRRYAGTAEELRNAPELAGARLQVALTKMQLAYGGFFQKVGAGIQDYLTNLADFATNNKEKFIDIAADIATFAEEIKIAAVNIATPFILAFDVIAQNIDDLLKKFEPLINTLKQFGKIVLRVDGFDDFTLPPSGLPSRQERASAIRAQLEELFGEFIPDKFGLGLRKPGDRLDDTEDDNTEAKTKKIKTTSADILNLTERLQEARFGNNKELEVQTEFLIRNQKLTEQLQAGEIDANTFKVGLLNSENKLREDGIKLRKQAKNGEVAINEEISKGQQLFESIKETVAGGLTNAINGLIDGTKSLSESLAGILRQLASLAISFGVKSVLGLADGGVLQQGRVMPYARGGVVNRPTLFPMANGMGLMGEAGPEAIMPLRRGPSGKLGVEASGNGMGSVVVNVDASGSSVQGDSNQAKQLGNSIAAAIQAELIKQRRPGGLLR